MLRKTAASLDTSESSGAFVPRPPSANSPSTFFAGPLRHREKDIRNTIKREEFTRPSGDSVPTARRRGDDRRYTLAMRSSRKRPARRVRRLLGAVGKLPRRRRPAGRQAGLLTSSDKKLQFCTRETALHRSSRRRGYSDNGTGCWVPSHVAPVPY